MTTGPTRRARRTRQITGVLLVLLAGAALGAAAAWADAPDPKLSPDAPIFHIVSTQDLGNGTTKVTIAAGWDWPTHDSDCNLGGGGRAGVGFAVDWSEIGDANEGETADPLADVGYHVTRLPGPDGHAAHYPGPRDADDLDVDVGSTGSNGLNAQDNVVHPTPTMNTTGIVQTNNEVDVANPSQFALWRGGCGTFTWTDHYENDGLDPEGIAGPRAHVLNAAGVDQGAQPTGISHIYYNSVLAKGGKICAIYYDVHGTASGVTDGSVGGTPGADNEITAGGAGNNDDNGATKNDNTPLGNACRGLPTAVMLSAFTARHSGRNVVLRWRTSSESTVLGFNVYRERAGNRVKLNRTLIHGVFGGTPTGHSYSFVDRNPTRAAKIRYWLQTVGLDGQRIWQRVAVARS
jgi:hypothetical protein